jgi:hypothetical protein
MHGTARLPVLRTRVPLPMLAAVEAAAEASQTSLSATLRELLAGALTSRGLWPPAPAAKRRRVRA